MKIKIHKPKPKRHLPDTSTLQTDYDQLKAAARAVVCAWESGDLVSAVNELDLLSQDDDNQPKPLRKTVHVFLDEPGRSCEARRACPLPG